MPDLTTAGTAAAWYQLARELFLRRDPRALDALVNYVVITAYVTQTPALEAPRYLWTQTADVTTTHWACTQCPDWGVLDTLRSSDPADHVTATGHRVFANRTHTIEIQGVSY